MQKPKLSVVIPIWGVESYIEKCARSLFESTLEDIEYIFVDDCSPDKSIEILEQVMDEYPKRKNQSLIIRHEKNKGLPQARKTGYEHSTGQWIIHCDSDDTVDRDMYSKMYDKAIKDDCDIVLCDLIVHTGDKVLWRHCCQEDDAERIRMGLLRCSISNSLCTKIVKREIYEKNDIYFPFHMIDEDDVLTSQLAYYAKNVGYVHEPLYIVYANPYSMSRQKSKEKKIAGINDQIENRKWIVGFYESKNDKTLTDAIFFYKKSIKYLMCELGGTSCEIKNMYHDINNEMIFRDTLSIKERIKNFTILNSPVIYRYYTRLFNMFKFDRK